MSVSYDMSTVKQNKERPHLEHGQVVGGNVEKDPERWSTGDEPMTGAQLSYPWTTR